MQIQVDININVYMNNTRLIADHIHLYRPYYVYDHHIACITVR